MLQAKLFDYKYISVMAKRNISKVKLKDTLDRYCVGLNKEERARYEKKLALTCGEDPYEIDDAAWSVDDSLLPAITYPDIVNYLVFSLSPYTSEDLKNFKALDAYNQFVSGWVRDRTTCILNDRSLVKAKVLHSQRLREKPLLPWFIADKEGCILAAHCTCMAGLGESCTHVAALLFSVGATIKLRDSRTVTQSKSYWLLTGSLKGVSYKQCKDINFTSAKKKKLDRNIDSCLETDIPNPCVNKKYIKNQIPDPIDIELASFFKSLSSTSTKPALLSLCEPYCEQFAPKSVSLDFPTVLTELKEESAIQLPYDELSNKCRSINLTVTEDQATAVERETREQASSKLWFKFQSGRITASVMKSVCATDPASPSQSLIKRVCYPESCEFFSKATQWGCEHEKDAKDIFLEQLK
ncbi:uncharacterized protein LOC143020978 [Oratosquilla oratoria]|uniref:uncharacterized protein LOC143020978 n=1 Tax=Oratosquilla oratoria TaxID=337810 RepID=UPI003F761D2C